MDTASVTVFTPPVRETGGKSEGTARETGERSPMSGPGANHPGKDAALSGREAAGSSEPGDRVSLSPEGREKSRAEAADGARKIGGGGSAGDADGLTEAERAEVQRLQKRDAEVKAHERAHMSAGAGLVRGGATYEYVRGPDGQRYAVGGEVQIDTSPENDPQATILKMQRVKRAALAPAEPSGTDRAVAAQAGRLEAEARARLREERIGGEENGQGTAAIPEAGKADTDTETGRESDEASSATGTFKGIHVRA